MSKSSGTPSNERAEESLAGAAVKIATILRAHGIRGALVLGIDRSIAAALFVGMELDVAAASGPRQVRLTSIAPHRAGVLVHLGGITDRSAAEALLGAELFADRSLLPPVGPGEYYDVDVLGMKVISREGEQLGVVSEVLETGANDVYVVRGTSGEVLVPVVAWAVLDIDHDTGRVLVEASALEYSGSNHSVP